MNCSDPFIHYELGSFLVVQSKKRVTDWMKQQTEQPLAN